MEHIRYSVAACQTDMANPLERRQMRSNTDRMLRMIDAAVAGSAPFLPVRLVVFPEFAHAAPVFPTVQELLEKLTVPIPNEHTERLTQKAREHGSTSRAARCWKTIAVAGRGVQHDVSDRPRRHPLQVSQGEPLDSLRSARSPHDLPGYDEPLFPVVDTPIGRIGCAICYDWLFPEAIRQLAANGAELLVRVSAYMDPWGATEPMNWWTVINRAPRAREHRLRRGGESGREPAPLSAVFVAGRIAGRRLRRPAACGGITGTRGTDRRRAGRRLRAPPRAAAGVGHHMLAHLRTEAYPVYRESFYPRREKPDRGVVVRRECPPHRSCETERGKTPSKAVGRLRLPLWRPAASTGDGMNTARLAGIVYVLVFVTGITALLVRGTVGSAAGALAGLLYVVVTVMFYILFKPVNQRVSLIAAAVSLAGIAAGPILKVNPLPVFGIYCLLIAYLLVTSATSPDSSAS